MRQIHLTTFICWASAHKKAHLIEKVHATAEQLVKRVSNKVACSNTGMPIVSAHSASNWRRAWVNDHWELGQNTEIIIIIIVVVVGSGIFFQPFFFLFCFSYFRWRLVCLLFSDVTDFGLFFFSFLWDFAFSLGASSLKVLVGWVLIAVHLHVGNVTFFGASGLINFNKSL
jgi:hypothetical protein